MATISIGATTDAYVFDDQIIDETLDEVALLLETVAPKEGGFWIAGQFERNRSGEKTCPDPDLGHQRLWMPPGVPDLLEYDRPLHEDPDTVIDHENVVYV